MVEPVNSREFVDNATALVEAARRAGADAADAVVVRSRSTGVTVRLGKVESTESSESDEFSLRVFVGRKIASISANAGADPKTLAERAVAMAKVSPDDAYEGLAATENLVRNIRDLELYDPTEVNASQLTEAALATEAAALAVEGVTNSGGGSASAGMGGLVLVTSGGFAGHYSGSRFSRSVSAVAGSGTAMERDYDFSSRIYFNELEDAARIGRTAGERAVKRLNARKVKTGRVNVVYDPREARGIAGHLASAINGASVARKTSFLKDRMETKILRDTVNVTDDPLRIRGSASRPFDGEGLEGIPLNMIENGVLKHWFLSTSTAKELGLITNGRGARSGSTVVPSSTNFAIEPGEQTPEELIRAVGTGFYVTGLFGHGVDMVTGEYSRGANGFWIENGELAYPVSEVTLASNLKEMFLNLTVANDIDRNFGVASPTLVIEGMTLAGK